MLLTDPFISVRYTRRGCHQFYAQYPCIHAWLSCLIICDGRVRYGSRPTYMPRRSYLYRREGTEIIVDMCHAARRKPREALPEIHP